MKLVWIAACLVSAVTAQDPAREAKLAEQGAQGSAKKSGDPAAREVVRRLLTSLAAKREGSWSCRAVSPAYSARIQRAAALAGRGIKRPAVVPYNVLVVRDAKRTLWLATRPGDDNDWHAIARGPDGFSVGKKGGVWQRAQQPSGVWGRTCLVEPGFVAKTLLARIDKSAWSLEVETVKEQQRRYYALKLDEKSLKPLLDLAVLPQNVDYYSSLPTMATAYLGRNIRTVNYTAELRLYVDRKTKGVSRISYRLFSPNRMTAGGAFAVRIGGAVPPARAANKDAKAELATMVELDLERRAPEAVEAKVVESAWAALADTANKKAADSAGK